MKQVAVVGVGMGRDTITAEAERAISEADALLGAPRLIEPYKKELSRPVYLAEDIAEYIAETDAERIAVLVSGDVGFYSAAAGLRASLPGHCVRFVPGLSAVNAFFARLKLPWQDAALVSAHGRDANVADSVRRNRLTFCLAGNNVNEIGGALCGAGLGYVRVHVGENLGDGSERIYETTAEDMTRGDFPPLTVLLFENAAFDDRLPRGLPDDAFSRLEGIPMTKSETRAVALSRLNLSPRDICWDIGAGTGSVTAEMALSAYRGHVYAVERCGDAIALIERNSAAFHIGNVTAVHGEAPDALKELPAPDAVFIGGSGGELDGIMSTILEKNEAARIVLTAVTLETESAALDVFSAAGLEPEIVRLGVARGVKAGETHLMRAQNPVTIFSAGGGV